MNLSEYDEYLKAKAIEYFGITKEDQKDEFLVDDLSKAIQYMVNAGASYDRYDVLGPPKMTETEASEVLVIQATESRLSCIIPMAKPETKSYSSNIFVQAKRDFEPYFQFRWVCWLWDPNSKIGVEMTNALTMPMGLTSYALVIRALVRDALSLTKMYPRHPNDGYPLDHNVRDMPKETGDNDDISGES